MTSWFDISFTEAAGIVLSAAGIYVALLMLIKLFGLRSFSKMAAHDFAVTIAIGTMIGSVAIQKQPALLHGILAIATFLLLQFSYSLWRRRRRYPQLENEPLLLMLDGRVLDENLKKAQITHADLMAKLREKNVLHMSDVRAVVCETTGDVSVLCGESLPDSELMADVQQ